VTVAHEAAYMTTAPGLAAAGLGVAILPDAANTSASPAIHRVDIRRLTAENAENAERILLWTSTFNRGER